MLTQLDGRESHSLSLHPHTLASFFFLLFHHEVMQTKNKLKKKLVESTFEELCLIKQWSLQLTL